VEPEPLEVGVDGVAGRSIELGEDFGRDEEEVQRHRVGEQFANLEQRRLRDLHATELLENPEDQEDQRGPRAERTRDETRSQQCRVPEGAGLEAHEQKSRHGVDSDRERNREEDDRQNDPRVVFVALEGREQDVGNDEPVEQEIEIENEDVPGQQRVRKVRRSDDRHQMPDEFGSAEIHRDEEHAHDDRRNREQLADQDDVADRPPIVDVGGNHQHDGCRRDSDQERKVSDVETP